MGQLSGKTRSRTALTILELVIAVAMVTVIFAAVLPQFAAIRNSWDSRQGSAEALQNGRVLMDHITRNLSKAVRISDVTESSDTDGYIDFEGNDGNMLRYDIAANNYVEFGVVGDLADLAGPVSSLQFTCYDACDIDNHLSPVNDPNLVRLVKIDTTVINSAALSQNKSFTGYAYLRTNASGQAALTKTVDFEFDGANGATPALARIDPTHYLCAYEGADGDGWAVVLTVDTTGATISKAAAFEFEDDTGLQPALVKIDDTHYLCAYQGPQSKGKKYGRAVVLTVNTGSWTISKGPTRDFEDDMCEYPSLAKIDDTHYLCAYTSKNNDGWAVVLTVDTGDWSVSEQTAYEFDSDNGVAPDLAKIDTTHYLCAYTGANNDGWAVVLIVDTGDWSVSNSTALEFDASNGQAPALVQVDSTHYLCAYEGQAGDGWVFVLTVNTGSWTISAAAPFEFDDSQGVTPALAQIDANRCLCAYAGASDTGWAVILNVDTDAWTITKDSPLQFDSGQGTYPALMQIDTDNYLCAYTGQGSDGWATILQIGEGIMP